jgi:hypothetical protein
MYKTSLKYDGGLGETVLGHPGCQADEGDGGGGGCG